MICVHIYGPSNILLETFSKRCVFGERLGCIMSPFAPSPPPPSPTNDLNVEVFLLDIQ